MKKFLWLLFIFTMAFSFAENKEDFKDKEFPIKVSQFKIIAQYYGLPLSAKIGWFYRQNDISIFPNLGFSFFASNELTLNGSLGFTLQKEFFTWDINAVYDIIPLTIKNSVSEQVFYGKNNFIFSINKIKFSLPARFGKKRIQEINYDIHGNKKSGLKTVTELSQGIRLDFFIADIGYLKSTAAFSFFTNWIPQSNFFNYKVQFDIPVTFNLYYVDLAFMYSFYHTDKIKSKRIKTKKEFETAKTQEILTGRSSFKNLNKYNSMHIFASEIRWYAARTGSNGNGFFISLFADTGFGITDKNKTHFIAEYGIGTGYNMFDNVPFTFQAGLNQSLQPVFYLGVVSKIIHLP